MPSKLQKFSLVEHPICCFCGGNEPATTEDHQPPRAIFNSRVWPEGYSFPACKRCNDVSRQQENIFAFLARTGPSADAGPEAEADLSKIAQSVMHNYPEAFIALSNKQKRAFHKSEGKPKPDGATWNDISMMGIDTALSNNAMNICVTKIFCAFHYKHTGKILPPESKILFWWVTNAYAQAAKELSPIKDQLSGRVELQRNNKQLKDQFDYAYGIEPASNFSAYWCVVRDSFVLCGFALGDPAAIDFAAPTAKLLHPFDWRKT